MVRVGRNDAGAGHLGVVIRRTLNLTHSQIPHTTLSAVPFGCETEGEDMQTDSLGNVEESNRAIDVTAFAVSMLGSTSPAPRLNSPALPHRVDFYDAGFAGTSTSVMYSQVIFPCGLIHCIIGKF